MTIEFAHPTVDIPRDRWGRPIITPADGGKPIPYTRVSTLAKYLDSKDALMAWKQRKVAIGLGRRPDLVARAKVTDPDDKGRWSEIVKGAMDAAESDSAANLGTALHAMAEQVDDGAEPESFGADFAADLTAYREAMSGIEVLASERFIVCDQLQAAGTFDRLLRLADGTVVIGDVKTGQSEPSFPHGVATQCAIYARGHLYDHERGRTGHLPELGVSTEVGLLIHMPAGKGACTLYRLNLTKGWALAVVAVSVKAAFSDKSVIQAYQP